MIKAPHTPTTVVSTVKGRRFKSHMKPVKPKQYSKGRVCSQPDCSSVLSMYNRLDVCFQHQPRKPPRIRGLSRKREVRVYDDVR